MGSDSSPSTYSVQMPEPRLHSGRSGRKSRNRDQSKISALGLSIFSSGETESKRLHNALERARAPDPNPAPKARSFDTVLCLDTSASMLQGGALEQMKKAAIEFVNGVEDVVNDTGVEENIGIVTFGGFSNIVQHLTNDFARVRDAIESMAIKGKSPFFEAMVVCLAAFDGRGGTVSVSGEYDVHPRIVFITDGHITECTDDPYGPDRVHDPTNTRAGFSRLMMDLSPKTNPSMPHPILFVPVGSRADRSFLESMAKLNDSHLVEADMITSLCNYFRVQETIGKVIVCLHNKDTDSSDGQIEAVVRALVPDIKSHEMREVLSTVKEELKQPSRKKSQRTNPTDFDEVHEDTEGVDRGERLPLGTRVKRGPDWKWGDQDGGGAGTVVQHEDNKHPFTWVQWDSGEWNRYPYGAEMGYHVWKTEEHPVFRRDGGELEIGMIVRKGSKWNQPDRDDYPGVVIRKSRGSKRVKVRWQSGQITACPADTVEFKEKEREKRRVSPIREEEFHSDDGQDDENKIRAWQWMDDWGDWHLYTQDQNRLLEKSFQRSKTGTCLVERSGKQFRVLFRKKVERDVSKGLERDVHRVLLPRDEYASLLLAEELMSSNH
ncbi:uncharacterized protein [Littorina saxatilis]|uniref:uncharacterized protein n=1 Tax=Littorina saxatilis TaxID=31220 RepID=UPI0038B4E8FD